MNSVLYFGGNPAELLALGTSRRMGDGEVRSTFAEIAPGEDFNFLVERDAGRALRRLSSRAVDVTVVDARGIAEPVDAHESMLILDRLFPRHDSSGPARRLRTIVLVDSTPAGARAAFRAGAHRIADVMVAPRAADVLLRLATYCARTETAKIGVCLAGGGIEGLLYELGVLRALDHFLADRALVDFDMFCGISAGAVVASLLANGIAPARIADGFRVGTDDVERFTRRDLFDPNFGELGTRMVGLVRDLVGLGDVRNPVSALYRAIPTGVFAGNRLREYLRRQLERPGRSNHFDDLRRPLFVGATDQDTAEAVVFGETGWTDVPVHRAVRASCALIPFYRPEKIGGRYYIDGAFTRTTNMRVAVKHGATLAIVVDPLVPLRAETAGHVSHRGGLFATMQGLKSLINGRFDKAVGAIRELYPHVNFHLFTPEGDEMRILSGSPMKFLYRQEIEELAFQRTLRKIRASLPDFERNFARAGVVFREPPAQTDGAKSPFEEGLAAA